MLHSLLALEVERSKFIERLTAFKQAKSGGAPLELTASSFDLLVDLLRRALNEARMVADFQTPLDVLQINDAFFELPANEQQPRFLWLALRGLSVWRNMYFWEFAVFSRIELTKQKKLPSELLDENRPWNDIPVARRQALLKAEQEVVTTVLTDFTQYMVHMGVGSERAKTLVSQMCSLASLPRATNDMLYALINNIERVLLADSENSGVARDASARDNGEAAADQSERARFLAPIENDDELEADMLPGGHDVPYAIDDVIDVLTIGGASSRRLGGADYEAGGSARTDATSGSGSTAKGKRETAKQIYARLIELQRRDRVRHARARAARRYDSRATRRSWSRQRRRFARRSATWTA